MLTSRERITAAFEHRAPDRTPCFEYVLLPPFADLFLDRPYAADEGSFRALEARHGWDAAVRQSVCDRLDLAQRLGHVLVYLYPTPPPLASHATAPGATADATRTPGNPVERLRERNRHRAAAPLTVPETELQVFRLLREEMTRRGLDLPVLAPAYVHGVWTDTDLMETMALAPEVAHRHFALATTHTLARIEQYLALGIELIGVGGDFAGNRPLITPAAYREFIVPEVRILAHRIHAGGARAVNASDGNLWSVIADFLYGCEVDGYLEIDAHAGMGDGGHVFCASNAITASVPPRSPEGRRKRTHGACRPVRRVHPPAPGSQVCMLCQN